MSPGDGAAARSLLQTKVREEVRAGRDVLSVSQTPAVERALAYLKPCYELLEDRLKGEPGVLSVLVLVPTREAAIRLKQEAERLGQAGGYKAAACYRSGAAPLSCKREQLAAISTATILIATPGKLKDLINGGQVDLSRVFYLVLDGADKMLQMGLEPQVRDIIERVPSKRQSLMFSESLGSDVKKLAKDILSNHRRFQLMLEPNRGSSVVMVNPKPQTERKAVKRSRPDDQRSAADKEKYLAYYNLCSLSKAWQIR